MKSVRQNGFNWPLHIRQVLLWILTLVQIVSNELCFIQIFSDSFNVKLIQITYAILYHLSLVFLIISGFYTTMIDPTDALSITGIVLANKGPGAVCALCKSSVSLSTRHCGQCNRCVKNFDHHCKWVNNCIGAKNYKWFIVAIVSLAFNSLFIFVFGVILCADYFENKITIHYSLKDFENAKAWLAIVFLMIIYGFVVGLLAFNLVLFHVYLFFKKITTFDYVLKRRKAKVGGVRPGNETICKEPEVVTKIENNSSFNLSGNDG